MILEYTLYLVLIRNAHARLIRILSKPEISQADIENINMLCGMIEEASENIRREVTKKIIPDRSDKNLEKYL